MAVPGVQVRVAVATLRAQPVGVHVVLSVLAVDVGDDQVCAAVDLLPDVSAVGGSVDVSTRPQRRMGVPLTVTLF